MLLPFKILSWMCQLKFKNKNNFDRLLFFVFFFNPSPLHNKSYQLWCNPSLLGYNSEGFSHCAACLVLPGWTFESLENWVVWISWEDRRGFVTLMRRIKSGFGVMIFFPSNKSTAGPVVPRRCQHPACTNSPSQNTEASVQNVHFFDTNAKWIALLKNK